MQNLKMTPATILLTATFQVISNCMNNGSITQHVIANRFLHTNSKEASVSIDAKPLYHYQNSMIFISIPTSIIPPKLPYACSWIISAASWQSSSNQKETPSSQLKTPYGCPSCSMDALTMDRPTPLPPYSLVLALSTL